MTEGALPLEGIRILDLSRLIPGAYCTAILGDAGAEVIKVEELKTGDYEREIPPFVNQMASRFLILNRNKKSVALDLKKEEGHEVFLKLTAASDVVLECFRPGTMDKLGLGHEELLKINPRLIYCSISSFGQDGPYRDVIAHDINTLGMAGLLQITGTSEGDPAIPGMQLADSMAGMNAALAILLSLIDRTRTGQGRFIDISMYDGVFSLLFDAARYAFTGTTVPERGKGRLWGGFPNYSVYATKDGGHITVGALETKFKRLLLKKLGREDLAGPVDQTTSTQIQASDAELREFLQKTFLQKTRDQWVSEFNEMNICVGPVNTVEEAVDHPLTRYREMVLEMNHPVAGAYKQIGSALKSSPKLTDIARRPAPGLGEHTEEILSELGYDQTVLERLRERGIIRNS